MPNCFSLTRKSDLKAGPVKLTTIDEEMCKHFNVPCDPKLWYHYWYDIIGFGIATGKSLDDQRKIIEEQIIRNTEDSEYDSWDKRTLEIINWLDENFTSDTWAEIGRR